MDKIKHSSEVTSQALSVIERLYKPDTGFEKILFSFHKLDERVSDTVVDQFLPHTKHVQNLVIQGLDDLPETDRQNVVELA